MSKRVTLKQVAAFAGVSFQTVSKVLNHQAQVSRETSAKIWRAVQVLGYSPDANARDLRTRRCRMIGHSWTPPPSGQSNPILERLMLSMMDAADSAGYYILPFPSHAAGDPLEPYRVLIHSGRVDGFVLSSVSLNDPRVSFLQDEAFPFVAFGRSNPECEFPFVDVDGAAGVSAAVEHLIDRGHRRIAALAWPANSRVGQDRLAGLHDTLQRSGIPLPASWVARGPGQVAFGREATRAWLDAPPTRRPTAIVALDDMMAIGALCAAQECGVQVGTDLAVVGFDDVPLAEYLTPPLTTVRQPIGRIGRHVVEMLVGILEGSPPANPHVLLTPELIIRESG